MEYFASENRYANMQYSRVGGSGLMLPRVSLGLWHNFGSGCDMSLATQMLTTAFDCGITHFDLANNYGPTNGAAEENFGKIISTTLKPYRDELVISTKAGYKMWEGPYGDFGSRKYLLASLDQSLKRMQVDYVDIFYHHRMDKNTPLEESMGALDMAVKSGRALYAGLSNYDADTMIKAANILRDLKCPFIINQVRYSMLDRHIEQDNLMDVAEKSGIGLITFSPLAQGVLSDRYLQGIPQDSRIKTDGRFLKQESLTEGKMAMVRGLNEIAKNHSQSLAQLALSWNLKNNAVTSVLIGASKVEQIKENVQAIFGTNFSKDEIKSIDKLTL